MLPLCPPLPVPALCLAHGHPINTFIETLVIILFPVSKEDSPGARARFP